MRQANLFDAIEFILRQHSEDLSAQRIHEHLLETELPERRGGITALDILYTAKAEPLIFTVDQVDRIGLNTEYRNDLGTQFKKRLWLLRDTLRAFPEEGLDLTMAVLTYALATKQKERNAQLWPEDLRDGGSLMDNLESISSVHPDVMKPVMEYVRNTPLEYRSNVDRWLRFAALLVPKPMETVAVMREFASNIRNGSFTTPSAIATLMRRTLGRKPTDNILDMTIDAGVLPFLDLEGVRDHHLLRGYYSNPVGSMLVQLEVALLGHKINVTPFTSSLVDEVEYTRIIAAPPMGRMRDPFPLGGASVDSPTFYLEQLRGMLAKNGRAVALVPVSVLFGSSASLKRLREEMVRLDELDTVMELPQGSMRPYANVNMAILVLDRNKPAARRGLVLMHRVALSESSNRVPSTLEPAHNKAAEVFERRMDEPGITKVVTSRSIELQGYDISPARYVDLPQELSITTASADSTLVKLEELIIRSRFKSIRVADSPKLNALPNAPMFVRVSDLAKDPNYPVLRMRSTEKIKGHIKLVDSDAILVSQAFNRLAPTIFRYKNRMVALGQHVMVLVPDTERILPEYLVHELNQPYVQQQIKSISRGVTIKRFTEADFRGVVIQLVPKADQRRIITERKDWTGFQTKLKGANVPVTRELILDLVELLHANGLEAELDPTVELFTKLTESAQRYAGEQIRTELAENLGFLAHNFNNRLRRVQGRIRNIDSYIKERAKGALPITLSDPIRPPLAGEARTASTVQEVMEGLVANTKALSGLIEAEQQLLVQRSSSIEVFDILETLRTIGASHAGETQYALHLRLGLEPRNVVGNERRFAEVVDNILANAVRHGFDGKGPFNIEVEVLLFGQSTVQVLIANDGTAPDLPFAEMLRKGVKSTESKGLGHGLYMSKRWIQGMNGELFDASDHTFRRPITFAVGIELEQPKT